MRELLKRARSWLGSVPPLERRLVATAMALSMALVIAYVLATRPNELIGDQSEYHQQAILLTDGKWWWSDRPYGIPHASPWRTPLYTVWVGAWYELFGAKPTAVLLIQSLLAALTVGLSWALARRLFGPTVAVVSAFVVAVFPLVWEWFGLLYTEAFAVPLALLALLLFLERKPTPKLAVGLGTTMGVGLLVRPSAFFLFAGAAAAWIIAAGWRRGVALTLLAVAVSALVVLPWSIRNYVVADGVVPISMQDVAIYGTFNDVSANDPIYPYAWRARTPEFDRIVNGPVLEDAELRSELQDLATDYIKDHPFSVIEAFYWNGLSRYWDVRRPGRAVDEVAFEGRSEPVTILGLVGYYVMLPLAVFALWRQRQRRSLVIPVIAIALAASIVFTTASGTRYRAPLEPLIAILAVSALVRPGPAREPAAAATPA